MELRHLRYFVAVAKELSVSRAAKHLHITQPAVSRQLRDLENELGVELFHREKSGFRLTPAGANFLSHARDLLWRSEDAVRHLEIFRSKRKKQLQVGYIPPVLTGIMTPALRHFHKKFSEVEVVLKDMSPAAQLRALREKKLDLAFIGNPCPEVGEEFAIGVLVKLPFQAVLPDDHLYALRSRLALRKLSKEPFVGFREESFPGRNDAITKACQTAGFIPRFSHYVENLTALLASVAAGKGVTLAPDEVSRLGHPQAVFIPLEAPVPSIVSVAAWRQDDDDNPHIQELVRFCMAMKTKSKPVSPWNGRRARSSNHITAPK